MKKLIVLSALFCIGFSSCKKYLDIIPDNVATIEYAFRLRTEAEKYLFTCYSYMPKQGDVSLNPAFMGGDETWYFYPYAGINSTNYASWEIARGAQNSSTPLMSYWNGTNGAKNMFQAIRDCNIFLENINKVPDMDQYEKDRWSAEVIFLKAYYHYWLLRMYGPIPIIDTNLPISSSSQDVQVERMPVDSCFNYIVNTLDEAVVNLPARIENDATELGRITKTIAKSLKAEVLVTAASPLFNGNTAYNSFKSKEGVLFFNQLVDRQKWVNAVKACKEAIDMCAENGYKLNRFSPAVSLGLPPELQVEMDIRTTVTESWNSETIWGNPNSTATTIQNLAQPRVNAANKNNFSFLGTTSVPLKIVSMFYTKNGVPVDEDKVIDLTGKEGELRTAVAADKYYIYPSYTTSALNFEREPRFYADLGFDGSIFFGQGNQTIASLNHLEARQTQYTGWGGTVNNYNITGYWPKKLVNYLNVMPNVTSYTVTPYVWPVIRLADLYLLYSEAINEVDGPTVGAQKWIDAVRERAGLLPVATAWSVYSKNPAKYTSKEGFRDIIHRERLIEMAFEGKRFWDLRRWKEAETVLSQPIRGWNIAQLDAASYSQPVVLFTPSFKLRDYFWPIAVSDLLVNKKMVQNPGW
jgi:hypothetical protein